uniref:ERI1 exoribonuclease 2 n=1 Tax=Sphaeramia orbicularis TaxID=375764 RepID=A0A672YIP9_9TELE
MSTKKLAKELGLLRQRSHASSGTKKSPLSNQVFSHLIVIDFESTCWREKNNYGQEIIEFPAVLLNTSTGEVESEFHTYVQPQEHPILSEFCTELTGITQVQVEAGIPLRICLSRFSRWLQNLQHQMGVVFPSMQQRSSEALPSQKLCTFLTWSDWDLGVCLQYECKRKQIHKPDVLNSWIDLRSTYRLFYNRKPKGLNGALQDLGIQFEGREHSGLDDARNTAQLAARMMRDGCIMKITRSLERVSGLQESVHSLVSPKTVLSGTGISSWGHSRRSNTANIVTNLCSSDVINSTSSCSNNSLVLCSTTVGGPLHVPRPNQPLKTGAEVKRVEESVEITVESEDRCGSYDDVVLDGDDVCSVTDFEYVSDVDSTSSCPTPKNTLSSLSANTLSSWSTNRSFVPRTLKGGLKITAPFCSCGRRAKRQVVSNGGPNQGRWFYCCPVRHSGGTCGRIQKGCEFFKWESAVDGHSTGVRRAAAHTLMFELQQEVMSVPSGKNLT